MCTSSRVGPLQRHPLRRLLTSSSRAEHRVAPQHVELYKQLIEGYYKGIAESPEFDCRLTGSWEIVVGEVDTFGTSRGAQERWRKLTGSAQCTSGSTRDCQGLKARKRLFAPPRCVQLLPSVLRQADHGRRVTSSSLTTRSFPSSSPVLLKCVSSPFVPSEVSLTTPRSAQPRIRVLASSTSRRQRRHLRASFVRSQARIASRVGARVVRSSFPPLLPRTSTLLPLATLLLPPRCFSRVEADQITGALDLRHDLPLATLPSEHGSASSDACTRCTTCGSTIRSSSVGRRGRRRGRLIPGRELSPR